ncbi:hypothetical protein ACS0TY_011934 [Phlomoides rotata]
MAEVAKTRASSAVKGAGARAAAVSRTLSVIRENMPRFVPPRLFPMPAFGSASKMGRLHKMEDAVDIKMSLCSPIINQGRPVHYFGVYDGHGGSHFAIMCKEKLHAILKEELMSLAAVRQDQMEEENVLREIWRVVISRVFTKTERVALHTCVCGSVGFRCNCGRSVVSYSGTTAVVVVLTENHIVVGNCGDSRAVLYRGGNIVPLSFDHKPDRADEEARIKASGGLIINIDIPRVEGVLAMSRAIGDKNLKPFVISEPEVTFTRRDKDDEFLILASDGMWDVISNDMAGLVARECLKDTGSSASGLSSVSAVAAELLSRLAFARGSADNISVVVVDLKRINCGW